MPPHAGLARTGLWFDCPEPIAAAVPNVTDIVPETRAPAAMASLRVRLAVVTMSTLAVFAMLVLGLAGWTMQRQVLAREAAESHGDVERALMAFDAQARQLDVVLAGWSNWSALHADVDKPDSAFLRDEINATTLRAAQLDWLIIFDRDGKVLAGDEVPQAGGGRPALSDWVWNAHRYRERLLDPNRHQVNCGVARMDQLLTLLCHRPLLRSNGTGPEHGTVVLGRWIDQSLLSVLRNQTNLELDIVFERPAGASDEIPGGLASSSVLGAAVAQHQIRDGGTLDIYYSITGVLGKPVAELHIRWPRISMELMRDELVRALVGLGVLIAAAAITVVVLVDRLVVRRLRRLSAELSEAMSRADWAGTITIGRRDEIGALADSSARLLVAVRQQTGALRDLTLTDTLTGLANRRAFDDRLAAALRSQGETAAELSLLMIDIDHFKRYNDRYGHPAGDVALREVARCLRDRVHGATDLCARLGGEEFAVLMDATGPQGAVTLARSIHAAVLARSLTHEGNPPLGVMSISGGIACALPGDTPETLYARADAALYEAKASGRNRVIGPEGVRVTGA